MSEPLTKIDSAVAGLTPSEAKKGKRVSQDNGVMNINDLGMNSVVRYLQQPKLEFLLTALLHLRKGGN